MNTRVLAAVCAVAFGFAGCGGSSGACLTGNGICEQSPPRSFDANTCVAPWTWYPGETCADVGYPTPCPTEKAGCYCQVSNPYCP
jgi:hypothetical protein